MTVSNAAPNIAMPNIEVADPLRILFVEDNAIVREQTTELLASNGRDIVACETAEQALAELERREFDVIITDMSLPAMSGMDLTKRVLEKDAHAWIVILSGYLLKVELTKLGPNVRALAKPFETEQLDAILNDVRAARLSGAAR
jgi:CheY-like chemotaxis protein